ncbi:MAG: AAA family ATPase [Nannocystaceae bacterium]|nr:AAA family ATPase [Nannocystaceae bacterium]
MRLKKIEVLGFKSFADRQVVIVDDHVTGVIGPNGCGKSNIVDAIRWCMGEQSAKHLRGSGMADVIFAGCSSRGPAGLAEVTLTFTNTGDVPPPYGDLPEIALTRRLFADGTSEYLINKVPARLRDISDLLAGTGVGTKGYSIIEQGQVGRIVSSKPEDRRSIIDEAAGITRFKAQKAAASRKIEATRQNLLRVRDVIVELDDRLGTLRRQAQKAERYKKYRQELRDLELWHGAHRWLELGATRTVLEGRRMHLTQQIDDVRASLSARDAQIATARLDVTAVEQQLVAMQQQVFDLDNRVRLREAEDDYRRREREAQQGTATHAHAEAEVVGRGVATVEAELAALHAEREAMGEGGTGREHLEVERLTEAAARVEAELSMAQSRRDAATRELGERGSALSAASARVEALGEAVAQARHRRVASSDAMLAAAAHEHELAERSERLDHARDAAALRAEALRAQRVALERSRAELKEQLAAVEVELDTGRAEVHRARSRLQSLEEIQARYRGCASGVQVVMEHQAELRAQASPDGVVGMAAEPAPRAISIVADHLEVPQHLEAALSAVLGDRLEGIVVDEPEQAARGVELLKRAQEGRLSFLPRSARVPASVAKPQAPSDGVLLGWRDPAAPSPGGIDLVDLSAAPDDAFEGVDAIAAASLAAAPADAGAPPAGVLGRLRDLVRCGPGLGELPTVLLGDTVVVEGLPRALELWHSRRVVAPMVTLDGDRIDESGVVVGGSPTALNAALLQQKREIRELQEILASLQQAFEATRGRHLAIAGSLADVEAARERNEAELLAVQTEAAAAEAECAAARGELVRVREAIAARRAEQDGIDRELALREGESAALQRTIGELQARSDELGSDLAGGVAHIESLQHERELVTRDLTEAKVALARWQQRSDALAGTAERLQRQLETERVRLARLEETAARANARVEELALALEQSAIEREQLVEQSREATAQVHDVRERHDAIRLELDELEASVKTLRVELDSHREQQQDVELGLRENQLELGHLEADLRERLDVAITEVLVDFHDRPLCGAEERERAAELKRVIARMGEVNLTAIEEFEEVSVRYEYLTRQRDDLEHSVAQLQEAIDRIDKTTRQMFRETFAAIDEKFRQIFPRLFAGGRAELKLTDPDDMLNTGIEIVAQPPGKQLRSLDLLSGGEKALTATSLIFAIFLIKPSPFCLLDEVDAPLDEVNVGRFCALVRELAATTQFVIITHNKVTMEIADRLYGVTMEQRGVSKLVSVNIRRAVELAYN